MHYLLKIIKLKSSKFRNLVPFPHVSFTKRQQFVTVTGILTALLIATQIFSGGLRLDILLLLSGLAYILSAIVLKEQLHGIEFVTLLTLPAYYTAAVFLFYFLLPTRWLTRLPIAFLYALGMYAILLTENIYNVAAERTIQLIRAAHSVGFLITLVTFFFLVDTILSMRLPFYINILFSLIVIFPLVFQALWSMELNEVVSKNVLIGTLVISVVLIELLYAFSFWPIGTTIEALFLTTFFYSFVGMTQQYLIGRLFVKTSREYVIVLAIVSVLVIVTTRWGIGIR